MPIQNRILSAYSIMMWQTTETSKTTMQVVTMLSKWRCLNDMPESDRRSELCATEEDVVEWWRYQAVLSGDYLYSVVTCSRGPSHASYNRSRWKNIKQIGPLPIRDLYVATKTQLKPPKTPTGSIFCLSLSLYSISMGLWVARLGLYDRRELWWATTRNLTWSGPDWRGALWWCWGPQWWHHTSPLYWRLFRNI